MSNLYVQKSQSSEHRTDGEGAEGRGASGSAQSPACTSARGVITTGCSKWECSLPDQNVGQGSNHHRAQTTARQPQPRRKRRREEQGRGTDRTNTERKNTNKNNQNIRTVHNFDSKSLANFTCHVFGEHAEPSHNILIN